MVSEQSCLFSDNHLLNDYIFGASFYNILCGQASFNNTSFNIVSHDTVSKTSSAWAANNFNRQEFLLDCGVAELLVAQWSKLIIDQPQ